ncbi:MAG TPA: hypothetical protein VFG58_07285, partial [Solirubrobacterales bacterium]|nr:hypothetical protein [Solirubrobacterales bacterium]
MAFVFAPAAQGAFPGGNGRIAFESNNGGDYDVYTLGAGGARSITAGSTADERNPAYSPDGAKVVFQSNRDGNYEIYVMNRDGSDATRLTDDAA